MRNIFKGSTSHSEYVALVDSTTGLPKTGIASTDVTGSYIRTRGSRTAITLSALAGVGASFSAGGWFEVDATNQPGLYRFDVPDAAFATGADQAYVTVKATNCKTEHKEFRLIDWNDQIAAIPNVAAGGAGGLPTGDASGRVDVSKIAGTSQTARDIGASVIAASVTGNVGGNVTGSVGSIATGGIVAASFAAGAIDASAIATDAIGSAEISAAAVTKIQSGLSTYAGGDTAGTTTLLSRLTSTRAGLLDNLDAAISTRLATAGYTAPPSAATIAAAVWDYLTSAASTVGSLGKLIATNLDAAISTRSTYAGSDTSGTTTLLSRLTSTRAGNLDNLDAAMTTRATPAQVNAEVVDALAVDTYAEPGQGAPAATATLAAKINYLYKAWRNKKTQTASTFALYADDAATVDQKATVSDDGTTTTIGEIGSGP